MFKIKVCGIRDVLQDYKYVDFIWFNFISYSKRRINLEKAKYIVDDILSKKYLNIKKIALLDDDFSEYEILNILKNCKLDGIQYYGKNDKIFEKIKKYGYFTIKPLNLENANNYKNDFVDLLIIDGKSPGSGKSYDYEKINKLNLNKSFLVAWWVNLENVADILKILWKNNYFTWIDVASAVDNWKNIDLEKVKLFYNLINKNV